MKTLSDFCLNICKAKCCKRGKLPLTSKESTMFDKKRIDENGFYDLTNGCQYLGSNSKCKIYFKRPKMCREYPFHHFGPKIIANLFCDGVKEGILDKEIEEKKVKKI